MARNSLLNMEIKGGDDLARALIELGNDRTIKAVLKRALNNRSAKRMVDTARSNAPKNTGRMAKKIAASTQLSKRQRRQSRGPKDNDNNSAVLYIGSGARGPSVLDEFGTRKRQQRNGKNTGSAPAQPFLRPAWEMFKDAILKDFEATLGPEIEKAAKRIARKQAKLIREGRA